MSPMLSNSGIHDQMGGFQLKPDIPRQTSIFRSPSLARTLAHPSLRPPGPLALEPPRLPWRQPPVALAPPRTFRPRHLPPVPGPALPARLHPHRSRRTPALRRRPPAGPGRYREPRGAPPGPAHLRLPQAELAQAVSSVETFFLEQTPLALRPGSMIRFVLLNPAELFIPYWQAVRVAHRFVLGSDEVERGRWAKGDVGSEQCLEELAL